MSCKMDLPQRPLYYFIRSPDGNETRGRFVYREIGVPDRLVWANSFSDKHAKTTRPREPPGRPRS